MKKNIQGLREKKHTETSWKKKNIQGLREKSIQRLREKKNIQGLREKKTYKDFVKKNIQRLREKKHTEILCKIHIWILLIFHQFRKQIVAKLMYFKGD